MEIRPGRRFVEFPHPRRHTANNHFIDLSGGGQAQVGANPHAISIPDRLHTGRPGSRRRHRYEYVWDIGIRGIKGQMLNTAISALLAVQEDLFNTTLQRVNGFPGARKGVCPVADPMEKDGPCRAKGKKPVVYELKQMIAESLRETRAVSMQGSRRPLGMGSSVGENIETIRSGIGKLR